MDRANFHRLILLLKELSARLIALHDSIMKGAHLTADAIGENIKATREADKRSPSIQTSGITVDVRIPREEADRYYAERNKPNRLQWFTFWVGVLSFAVLVWYAWTTMGLWKEASQANGISRENAIAAYRAFVFFSPALAPLIALKQKSTDANILSWRFGVPMENSGATPTSGMRNHVSDYPSLGVLPANFRYPDMGDTTEIRTVLGPKQTLNSAALDVDPNVLARVQSRLAGVENQTQRLYFYGWACYHDTLKGTPQRVTKFCYEVTGIFGDPLKPPSRNNIVGANLSLCPRYNCSDEDCDKDPTPNPCR
jgi:hypothetical protein